MLDCCLDVPYQLLSLPNTVCFNHLVCLSNLAPMTQLDHSLLQQCVYVFACVCVCVCKPWVMSGNSCMGYFSNAHSTAEKCINIHSVNEAITKRERERITVREGDRK